MIGACSMSLRARGAAHIQYRQKLCGRSKIKQNCAVENHISQLGQYHELFVEIWFVRRPFFSLESSSLSYCELLQVCIIVVFVALLGSSTEDIAGMVKQVGASSKVKKVHYPSSKFEVDKVQVRSKGNGLREVLKEICSKEEESLKPIFSLEGVSAKDALNKKNIHDALLEMMSRLNDSVAQDLDEEQETYFKPELSKEEREQIELKQNKLESLQKQLDKLNHYSENLNDFREAAGLWLGTAPAVKVQIWKFL